MRNRVFGHVWIEKAQIRLRGTACRLIRSVWSGPPLSANRIIWNRRIYEIEQRPGWYFGHAQDESECVRLAHARGHIFAWRTIYFTYPVYNIPQRNQRHTQKNTFHYLGSRLAQYICYYTAGCNSLQTTRPNILMSNRLFGYSFHHSSHNFSHTAHPSNTFPDI